MTMFSLAMLYVVANFQAISVKEFQNTYDNLVHQLICTAREGVTSNDYNKVYDALTAIRKLGILRADQAVPFLVRNIEFYPELQNQFIFTPGPLPIPSTRIPCVYALAQIGIPAFSALIAMSEEEFKETNVILIAQVFTVALGRSHAEAYLNHYAETTKIEEHKIRAWTIIQFLGKSE